jgi:hypothetical protein
VAASKATSVEVLPWYYQHVAATVVKTVKLPKKLAATLARIAKKRGCSQSELIRLGIERIAQEDATGIDMFKALRSSIGKFHGPGDLSYNKKYMRGFGRSKSG